MADEGTATCIDILIAIILPPLGVFLKYGCQIEFWICLLLTILGYIPGIIYAIWAITKELKEKVAFGVAGSRVSGCCFMAVGFLFLLM